MLSPTPKLKEPRTSPSELAQQEVLAQSIECGHPLRSLAALKQQLILQKTNPSTVELKGPSAHWIVADEESGRSNSGLIALAKRRDNCSLWTRRSSR
jgi:hypothetical protein